MTRSHNITPNTQQYPVCMHSWAISYSRLTCSTVEEASLT